MKKTLIILLIFTIFLTACWDQRIYERTGFILQVGIEEDGNGRLLFTGSSPVVEGGKKNQAEIITTRAGLLRESRENWKMRSPKILEGGKIQQMLFSSELAQKGIHEILEIYERDPVNPSLAYVVVVDGSPKEVIEESSKIEDKPRPAFYINQLLESSRQFSYIPETRIHNFDIGYFAPGLDPITPMIKLGQKEVEVMGSALFAGDKMVGRLNTRQTPLILAMMGKFKKTEYIFKSVKTPESHEKSGAAVLLTNVKRKIDIKIENDRPLINISLNFDGIVEEFNWGNLEENQEKIEEQLSNELNNDCNGIVTYVQGVGSDPVGIGDKIRAGYNDYWQGVDWQKAYKDAKISVDAKVDIKLYGVIK